MVKDYIGQLPVSCLGMRPVAYLSLKFASSPSARRFKPCVMMLDLGALSRFRPNLPISGNWRKTFLKRQ
jgi:hypothetical protein